jgi:putative two-component system response regulator
MGLGEKTVEAMLYAAPLHDLGKIGIPDRILSKPGKLASVEIEIMKQHTVIGAKILAGSEADFIKLGAIIALNHHEKWDGSGYPNGLAGNMIPIEGRIAAVADVFDALISKRPYKEPFSLEKSMAIIGRWSGSYFDPGVVAAFFATQEEIISIKTKYSEEDPRSFDIPELQVLLQEYKSGELSEPGNYIEKVQNIVDSELSGFKL